MCNQVQIFFPLCFSQTQQPFERYFAHSKQSTVATGRNGSVPTIRSKAGYIEVNVLPSAKNKGHRTDLNDQDESDSPEEEESSEEDADSWSPEKEGRDSSSPDPITKPRRKQRRDGDAPSTTRSRSRHEGAQNFREDESNEFDSSGSEEDDFFDNPERTLTQSLAKPLSKEEHARFVSRFKISDEEIGLSFESLGIQIGRAHV